MKKYIIAIAAVAALSTSSAFAEGYVGGAVGQSSADVDCGGTTNCKKTDTAFKVFGGFKFAPNLAAEVTYTDLGSIKATVPLSGTLFDSSIKSTSFGVGIAFMGEFAPQWKGVVRAGIASNRTKVSVSGGGLNGSDSETNATGYAGFGIGYELVKGLTLDAALDLTQIKYADESASVRLFSIGLTKAF